MGFNTVAFLLNDYMQMLEKAPKTATYLITHPPMGDHESERERAWSRSMKMSQLRDNAEPHFPDQALEVLSTFHADDVHYFRAGGNCMVPLKFLRFGTTKDGKRTVTLELPDWAYR